jgi:hypothetical protein
MKEEQPSIRRRPPAVADGSGHHLVEVFAYNTVNDVIRQARVVVLEQRGRFTLPSKFMDELRVDCHDWILERGATEAEQSVRARILDFLDRRQGHRLADDERKVQHSLRAARQ